MHEPTPAARLEKFKAVTGGKLQVLPVGRRRPQARDEGAASLVRRADHRGLRPHRDLAHADAQPSRRVPVRHRRQAAAVGRAQARRGRRDPRARRRTCSPATTRIRRRRAAAFTADGWFRTGDVGRWTEDGFLQIIDRKKDILVTAGGKNIPPANIEARFVDDPLIERVVVYGDARPYLVAAVWSTRRRSRTSRRRRDARRACARSPAAHRAGQPRARALRDDQAVRRRRAAAHRRERAAHLVAQGPPQEGLRAARDRFEALYEMTPRSVARRRPELESQS